MTRPIIGVTADRTDESNNIESQYNVRRNYCSAVAAAGGLPVILPYDMAAVGEYVALIDGLIITGGMFDIDPAEYGMRKAKPEGAVIKADRTAFERAMLRQAIAEDIPVLGICGGMQLIAVELGADLYQDLPSELEGDVDHKQLESCGIGTHRIHIEPGSLLHRLLGAESLVTNSLHHQAVMKGNRVIRIGAKADDGVIEAIEASGQTFCLGVQWHPEYLVNASEANIFAGLVKTARRVRTTSRSLTPSMFSADS